MGSLVLISIYYNSLLSSKSIWLTYKTFIQVKNPTIDLWYLDCGASWTTIEKFKVSNIKIIAYSVYLCSVLFLTNQDGKRIFPRDSTLFVFKALLPETSAPNLASSDPLHKLFLSTGKKDPSSLQLNSRCNFWWEKSSRSFPRDFFLHFSWVHFHVNFARHRGWVTFDKTFCYPEFSSDALQSFLRSFCI